MFAKVITIVCEYLKLANIMFTFPLCTQTFGAFELHLINYLKVKLYAVYVKGTNQMLLALNKFHCTAV